MSSLLVVAGEASGDAAIAQVLACPLGVTPFGIAGPEMRKCMDPEGVVEPMEHLTGMGVIDVARRFRTIVRARGQLLREAARRRPKAALLFNYSDFCTSLLAPLRALRVPTLFYSPPQVWAWRARRAHRIAAETSRMLVTLPFERDLWRRAGANVEYVGHPLVQGHVRLARKSTRAVSRIAILPGSRPREVASLRVMLQGSSRVTGIVRTVFIAPSLTPSIRAQLQTEARRTGATVVETTETLSQFDAALCYSGTATLECALAGVPPVIVGPQGRGTDWLAKRLLTVDHIGLPNLVLGRRVFPEHLGASVTADSLARSLENVLTSAAMQSACSELARLMAQDTPAHVRVAREVQQWV